MKEGNTVLLAIVLLVAILGAGGMIAGAIFTSGQKAQVPTPPAVVGTSQESGTTTAAIGGKTLVVNGASSISANADKVVLNFSVFNESMKAADAYSKAMERGREFLAALEASGIDPEDITTTNTSVDYSYTKMDGDNPYFRGSLNYEVTLRDLSLIESIYEVAAKHEALNNMYLNYDVEDRQTVYQEAMETALTAAREKAELLAAKSGHTVGNVISIVESGYSDNPVYARFDMAGASAIRTGDVNVTANLSVTYELLGD